MNEARPSQREKTRRTGAFALLATFAACLLFLIIMIVLGVKLHKRSAELADTQKQLADAKSDGAKAQQALDKANNDEADLKSQLEKSKTQATDLQAQADQAKAASADLQGQMDKAKAQTTDLQGQLDKANTQKTDLQNQLNQANAGSTQLLTQLDQAKIQSMDMQARLQKAENDIAQLQPMLLKARHMPVTTSFEKESWGRGLTLHVNNLNQQPLSVNLTIDSQGNVRTQSSVIGAASTLSVGKLAAGDKVAIASNGYETVNLTAN